MIEENHKKTSSSYVNPFVHSLQVNNKFDLFQRYVLTIFLLPIRIICICAFLLFAWLLTCIGLAYIKPEDLKQNPISGWRKFVKNVATFSMRCLFVAGSFNYVKFKGKQASSKEAPILVVSPHSSFMDAITAAVLGPPSILAKADAKQLPIFGKLINFSQPIYVARDDPDSRQKTIRDIIERATSKAEWPQILIFPEGTCTNRSALITFKAGAFYPGVPVQPVIIRYPNKYDTFTWTWEGPGVLELLWLTLTKFHNNCEIEFLPVYKPSDAEKCDPKLYANNVRDVMAKSLGIPTSNFSYDDCKIMTVAKKMRIPHSADIVEIERIRKILRLNETKIEAILLRNYFIKYPSYDLIDFQEFLNLLQLSENKEVALELFSLFDQDICNRISFKNYLLCSAFLTNTTSKLIEYIQDIVPLYCDNNLKINRIQFSDMMQHTGRIKKEESDVIFVNVDKENLGRIDFNDFRQYVRQNSKLNYLNEIVLKKSY